MNYRKLIGFAVFVIGLLFVYQYAYAQHSSHAQHHENFYKDLKRKDGVSSCCSDRDCRRADDWRMTPSGKYHVKIDGVWIMPPQWIVQHKNTPDGEAHACYDMGPTYENNGEKVPLQNNPSNWRWYCLIIPPTST